MISTAVLNTAFFFLGLYLITDSIYLANLADSERRTCLIARYVGAFMCGIYDLSIPVTEFLVHSGLMDLTPYQTLTQKDLEILLLHNCTIALFMWGDTFYRVLNWLKLRHDHWYRVILSHFEVPQRRR